MSEAENFHITYLETRLAKLKERPELNASQIKAYERVLGIAKSSTTYADYITKLGTDADLFSLAQSEHIDRYTAMSSLYEKMGLSENASAFKKRLELTRDCKSYMDLAMKLPKAISLPDEGKANERLDGASIFLQLLFQSMTLSREKARIAKALQAQAEFDKVKSIDPSFDFASFFNAPYIYINPFTKEQLQRLQAEYLKLIRGAR